MMPTVVIVVLALTGLTILAGSIRRTTIHPGEVGLLYRNGAFVRQLDVGVHRRFDPLNLTTVALVSLLPRNLPTRELTVLSLDRFSFRIAVAPLVTVTDPRVYHEACPTKAALATRTFPGFVSDPFERFGTLLTEAVLDAAARRSLEDFLANPKGALDGLDAPLAPTLPGTRLDALAIVNLVLPPELRKMFTEVERARYEGQAALERARSEQAALRALANAARNLTGNPQLAQLRTLHAMEAGKGAKTYVLGSLTGELGNPKPG